MASTYSDLKVELIGTGDQSGAWGTTTNTNLGTALGEAITGSADVSFSSADVTVTLTDVNTSQTARNLRLNLTGTTGGARNLILGSGCQIEKLYLINNGTADTVTVKNTTGTGIAVPAGKSMFVFNNGTNVVDAVTHLTSLTLGTDLAVADGGTGASTFTANNVLLGNGTSAFQVVAPGSTGNVLTSNGTTWTSAAGTSLATPLAVVGNATAGSEIRLPEDTDNGSNYVALKAADSITSNLTFTLPAIDGSSGQFLQTNGSGTLSFAYATGSTNLQEFTSSGTWTKPSGATFVMVEIWGAGGNGGSGGLRLPGQNSYGGGGGGGAGGGYSYRLFKASDLAATVSVTIGAGGGGSSNFGTLVYGYGGGSGTNGANSASTSSLGGGGGGSLSAGSGSTPGGPLTLAGFSSPIISAVTGTLAFRVEDTLVSYTVSNSFTNAMGGGVYFSPDAAVGGAAGGNAVLNANGSVGGVSYQGGAGGGAGGFYNNNAGAGIATNGGNGGAVGNGSGSGGAGGAGNFAATGSNGTSSTTFRAGGGGGGAGTNAGGNGGNGGIASGGGGGGGGYTAGGNGGTGGNGFCRVYTW